MSDYKFKIGDQVRYGNSEMNTWLGIGQLGASSKRIFTITKFYKSSDDTFWGTTSEGLSLLFYSSEVELVKTAKKRIG